jgi:CheY-like chemotaxis protein
VVRDSGIGIARESRPFVFDMFSQGSRSLEGAPKGLGVGLSLARALVQMHGGSIELKEPDGNPGAEFLVRLPVESAPPERTAPAPKAAAFAPRRVLIIDDNRDQATSLAMLLELMGHEVKTAFDARTAIGVAARFEPDLAMIDVSMPGMDGNELARRLRQDPSLSTTTLVALTGWGQEADRKRSRDAGFDYHLVKPADIAQVEKIIAAAPARNLTPRPRRPAPGGAPKRRK